MLVVLFFFVWGGVVLCFCFSFHSSKFSVVSGANSVSWVRRAPSLTLGYALGDVTMGTFGTLSQKPQSGWGQDPPLWNTILPQDCLVFPETAAQGLHWGGVGGWLAKPSGSPRLPLAGSLGPPHVWVQVCVPHPQPRGLTLERVSWSPQNFFSGFGCSLGGGEALLTSRGSQGASSRSWRASNVDSLKRP